MPFKSEDIIYVQTSNGDYHDEKTETIIFSWGIKNFGWGATTFYYEDGKLKCDNEMLSKELIKKIICEFIDRAEFDETKENYELEEK